MMATKTQRTKKTILALGVMLATSFLSIQAQADQLADIKAAGVVKVATFDANPRLAPSMRKPIRSWVTMLISLRRWQHRWV